MKKQYNLRIEKELLDEAKNLVKEQKKKGNKVSVTELIKKGLRKQIDEDNNR